WNCSHFDISSCFNNAYRCLAKWVSWSQCNGDVNRDGSASACKEVVTILYRNRFSCETIAQSLYRSNGSVFKLDSSCRGWEVLSNSDGIYFSYRFYIW